MTEREREVWRTISGELCKARDMARNALSAARQVSKSEPGTFLCDVSLAHDDLCDLAQEAALKAREEVNP